MKRAIVVPLLVSAALLAGCGSSVVQAATAADVLAAKVTLPSGTAIAAGTCVTLGTALTGATTSMAVTVSPAGDPQPAGLAFPMLFSGFVDAADHVTVKVCKVAAPSVTTTGDVTLNVRAIQ